MRSIAVLRDYRAVAREAFVAFLLSVIFLVTGCSSSGSMPRTAMAPPPPFITEEQTFGPPLPIEIAVMRSAVTVEPAAGETDVLTDLPAALSIKNRCHTALDHNKGHFGLGFGDLPSYDRDLSFASLHSGRDSAEMTISYTLTLPAPQKTGCR